jgi:hypothetical protein
MELSDIEDSKNKIFENPKPQKIKKRKKSKIKNQ